MSEQGKYPSNEDVADFITKSSFVTTGIINMSMTDDQLISIIRSACDWQREQGAPLLAKATVVMLRDDGDYPCPELKAKVLEEIMVIIKGTSAESILAS